MSLDTPITRRGPSSRVLQRQSLLFSQNNQAAAATATASPAAEVSFRSTTAAADGPAIKPAAASSNRDRNRSFGGVNNATLLMNTVLGSPEVTRPLYSYQSTTAHRLDQDDGTG